MSKEEKKEVKVVKEVGPRQEVEAKIALYKEQLRNEKIAGTAEQVAGTEAEIAGLQRILVNL